MLDAAAVVWASPIPRSPRCKARAIFEAAVAVAKEGGKVFPEVMIPLTATLKEMANQAAIVHRVAKEVFEEKEKNDRIPCGYDDRIAQGALVADEIAREAQFFSFGTNDLTRPLSVSRATMSTRCFRRILKKASSSRIRSLSSIRMESVSW